jgi:2-polyprenyl-6-methoxyphenol hydroxylase-like FAD-dependent oxidoreductase
VTGPLAIIAGAGVAGMSAAWWLDKIGWRVIVVERARDLRDGGYMMGLSGPGLATARAMGLLPRLEAVARRIDENVYLDRNGRELLRLRFRDFLGELPFVALKRTDLVQAIRDALPSAVEIRLGTTVTDVADREGGVTARLSDGGEIAADLLVAADGFRSWHRQHRFGPDQQFFKPLGYRFATYELADTLVLGSDFLSYAEPGRLSEYYTLADGRLAALHVWRSRDVGAVAPERRWPVLNEALAGSNERVLRMAAAAQAEAMPVVDDLTLVEMPTWSSGRVVLLGDAAHCLTLISGQGAGISMASAQILAEELDRGPIDAGLAAHEQRLRPAIVQLQQRSRKMAAWFIPQGAFAFHMRNAVLRHMPRRWLGRYFLNSIRSEIVATQALTNAR